METTRQNKISRLLQKELSEIFLLQTNHQLRIIPELKFFVDDSLDYIEKIDSLLK